MTGYTLIEWPERAHFSQFVYHHPLLITIRPFQEEREIIVSSYDSHSAARVLEICARPELSQLITAPWYGG
jgi:hypothetical protein